MSQSDTDDDEFVVDSASDRDDSEYESDEYVMEVAAKTRRPARAPPAPMPSTWSTRSARIKARDRVRGFTTPDDDGDDDDEQVSGVAQDASSVGGASDCNADHQSANGGHNDVLCESTALELIDESVASVIEDEPLDEVTKTRRIAEFHASWMSFNLVLFLSTFQSVLALQPIAPEVRPTIPMLS
jgi:hypothetical protein